ncbi:MAG TPA: EAL domain-containing protein [Steroidobacteraceae bacterium]|nr:EAL domain-containing protein [Steroidobacteraceae bacterium]
MDVRWPFKRAEARQPGEQQRLLLGVCLASLAVIGASLGVAARVFEHGFNAIDAGAAAQKARQVERLFALDLAQLQANVRDYAAWEDAATFIARRDRRFLSSNFTPDALAGMRVDLVWIVDRDGHELYSGLLDRGSGRISSPAPPELLQPFRRALPVAGGPSAPAPADRLVRTGNGLAVYAAQEITAGDHGPGTGTYMLFARFLGRAEVARAGAALDMPLELIDLPATLTPAFLATLPPAVRAWIAAPQAAPTLVRIASDGSMAGYVLARDLDGRPAALLATSVPRDVHALGTRTTRAMLGGIALLLLAAGGYALWLAHRLRLNLAAQRDSERRYASIAAQVHEAIMLVDAETGRIVEGNASLLRSLGVTSDELQKLTVYDVYADLVPEQLERARTGAPRRLVCSSRMQCTPDSSTDAEVSISVIESGGQALLCLVGRDITHRREAEQQQRSNNRKLSYMAQHDPLTGLPNRLYLRARLPRALRFAAATDRTMAVIYMDIDHFKKVNDSRGHGTGDHLLQTVARRLRAAVGKQDLVTRMSGDEFVIVVVSLRDAGAVELIAERIQSAVQAPIAIGEAVLNVSASMGIALFPHHGLDMESLLKHADIALYQAKEAGRRCHRLFSQDMLVRVSESVALEQALRRAVGTDQLSMVYQPIVDLRSGRIASLEALMRWRHPDLGAIPPAQFIPVADACGLTEPIGLHALREVLAQLRAWLDSGLPVVPIAVNISPVQFESAGFCELVTALAAEYGVEPHWLRFEITETALLKDPRALAARLQSLRNFGSQLLIDDFGTGYSGLSYLAHLPVDAIKIDRSFVSDIGRVDARASIVGAVIDMAKKLGMATIAEGVENAAQAAALRALGCGFAQGFHFSKPVSASHCRTLFDQLGWEQPDKSGLMARVLKSS